MKETLLIEIVGAIFALTGVLISTLLGVIIREMRQLREDLRDRVPQNMCDLRMTGFDGRLGKIERYLERMGK
ncbi:MAG: hypothetical protein MJ016_06770 [Victivallaceae bacterium]|nr:hypothetical protein [Victivallaceae bacterium]